MSSFQSGDVWLTFEQGGLHEYRADLLQEVNVLMPELADSRGYAYCAAEIQKYETLDGRQLWRSFTRLRSVFRDGYESRERCAQEVVRDCTSIREAIGWRRARLSREKSRSLQRD